MGQGALGGMDSCICMAESLYCPPETITALFIGNEKKLLSCVRLFATPWTVGHQAPLSVGFPRQENGVGCRFLLQGSLPDPGIEPGSPTLQADALTSEPPGEAPLQNDLGVK